MLVSEMQAFEKMMRDRGVKRVALCQALGISAAKWRRHVDDRPGTDVVSDQTLALAMAALSRDIPPWGTANGE